MAEKMMNMGDLLRGAPLPNTPEYERWRAISRCRTAIGKGVEELLREHPVMSYEERSARIDQLQKLQSDLHALTAGKSG